jgi:hypothetical protein
MSGLSPRFVDYVAGRVEITENTGTDLSDHFKWLLRALRRKDVETYHSPCNVGSDLGYINLRTGQVRVITCLFRKKLAISGLTYLILSVLWEYY